MLNEHLNFSCCFFQHVWKFTSKSTCIVRHNKKPMITFSYNVSSIIRLFWHSYLTCSVLTCSQNYFTLPALHSWPWFKSALCTYYYRPIIYMTVVIWLYNVQSSQELVEEVSNLWCRGVYAGLILGRCGFRKNWGWGGYPLENSSHLTHL